MVFDPILDSFARALARAPDAPLVLSPSRRASLAEVDALARALGARLLAFDLPPGALVALSAPNGPGFLAAWLAVRRASLVPSCTTPPRRPKSARASPATWERRSTSPLLPGRRRPQTSLRSAWHLANAASFLPKRRR